MPSISLTPPEACERNIRYIGNDMYARGDRIYFVQANHGQSVHVQPRNSVPFILHQHDVGEVLDILDKLPELTGMSIPDSFIKGTAVLMVPGLLHIEGVEVASRVLRQQIFLGASTNSFTYEQTHRILFNALGNALWNYLEHMVWGTNQEQKNKYRELRNYRFDFDPSPNEDGFMRGRTRMVLHQQTLFSVASEDFRYLFADALGGRGEWFYDFGPDPIKPPNPDVANFWRSELLKSEQMPEYSRVV